MDEGKIRRKKKEDEDDHPSRLGGRMDMIPLIRSVEERTHKYIYN